MKIKERFLTTGIGSLPFSDTAKSIDVICSSFDIPFWPQLPKIGFKENMYVQYALGLPNLVIDEKKKKIFIDTSKDLSEGLGKIFEVYLSEDYREFALTRDFAKGFFSFLEAAKGRHPKYIKGHVTGPVSFGLSVTDENGRSIFYNDTLKEGFIKLLEIKVSSQIDSLNSISKNVIIFIDEPYLTSFGSSFVSLEREDVILSLNLLIDKIHSKGALAGIHCCGNTDWSILTSTEVDIVNFDAYQYADSLGLYPDAISKFLKKGGSLAWGIVPTSNEVLSETGSTLFDRLSLEIDKLQKKGISKELLISNSLITPSCGMGTLSEYLVADITAKISLLGRLAKDRL
ncbi:MAG: methionine synthase [Candidatus Omnitrophota bacterium]